MTFAARRGLTPRDAAGAGRNAQLPEAEPVSTMTDAALFPSFWLGGYEGADHVNGAGELLDLVAASGHHLRLDEDYRAARRLGLRCLRESIGWRLTEREDGTMDFTRAVCMAEAAARQRVQILWTLMHYGLPADLTLFDDALIPRFARFAGEVARVLRPLCPGPRIYTPINEISFLCWAASATDGMGPAGRRAGVVVPDDRDHGFLIKQRLVRAALAGMDAIRAEDPEARFLHIEPVVHVVPRDDDPAHLEHAERVSSYQWQALDMLAGRMDPHLGGHPEALDLLGLNHYHTSQWEVPGGKRLEWHLRDPRRKPLSALLQDVWLRYCRPLIVAETGHVGVGRAAWVHEIAGEALHAHAAGVPLLGVCLYPLLDRPDWNDTAHWHRSGLWHLPVPQARRLNRPFARALLSWRGLNDVLAAPRPAEHAGLLVLLPCAWEDWQAPREPLLKALAGIGHVHLLEPPRAGAAEAALHRHSVAPTADLLVLHGRGAKAWSEPPTPAQLALLRELLPRGGRERWACWLAGWRRDGHPAWWRELARSGLILQPDAALPPQGELLVRARAVLPALWPEATARRPQPHSYEADEALHLLRGISEPRVWLMAPAAGMPMASRLRELAMRWPATQFLVDAGPPLLAEAGPANLHWLGRVHSHLHDALVCSVQRIVPWEVTPGWGALDEDLGADVQAPADLLLAEMVDRVVHTVLQLHVGPQQAVGAAAVARVRSAA